MHPFLEQVQSRQQTFLKEAAVRQLELDKQLASLVQTSGWGYAQIVANEILQPFECTPADGEKWQVYTTMQYAFNRLFSEVRKRAKRVSDTTIPGQSILAEIKESNADRSRGNEPASGSTKPSRRRTSARGKHS